MKGTTNFKADYLFEAISSVRHPAVVDLIEERVDNIKRYSRDWEALKVVSATGNTRLRKWTSFYESMKNRRTNKLKKVLTKAQNNMHPPYEDENPI